MRWYCLQQRVVIVTSMSLETVHDSEVSQLVLLIWHAFFLFGCIVLTRWVLYIILFFIYPFQLELHFFLVTNIFDNVNFILRQLRW